MLIGAWAVQDGLGIVLVRSFFRLAIRDRFFWPLGCLLESFWAVFGLEARFGPSWAHLGSFLGTPSSILESYKQYMPINSSAHQPLARQHFVTRAGGLRAERLNPPPPEGSERVRTGLQQIIRIL